MPLSPRERRRWDSQVASLRSEETAEEPAPDVRTARVRAADTDRSRRGRAPLADRERHPEEELYRRARALGMRRVDR